MKKQYTFEYTFNGKGTVTVFADSMEEAVEAASETAQDLLPKGAEGSSLEIGDLLDREPVCAWCEM